MPSVRDDCAVFPEFPAYEVQKGTGVGFTFGRVDTRKLDKLINRPWAADGSNWSDRIWTRKTMMTNNFTNELRSIDFSYVPYEKRFRLSPENINDVLKEIVDEIEIEE